jgi:hypothetical protein
VGAVTLRSAEALELLAFPKLALVYVSPGREGPASPMDDSRERLGISIEPPQHRIQGDDQLIAERVELLGPVEGDGRYLFLDRIVDQLVRIGF